MIFAAHLDRAERWSEVIRRSRQIELLASIDLAASDIDGIQQALEGWPDAAVAVWARGPREASRAAALLRAHDGPSIVHPPPLAAAADATDAVRIAHGWLGLSGVGAIERLFTGPRVSAVRLVVRGIPEGGSCGIAEVLYHALTLVRRLGRDVHVERAAMTKEDILTTRLHVDGTPWVVETTTHGLGLELAARTAEGDYVWAVDEVSETLRRPRAEARVMPATPWGERCLLQLARAERGADLEACAAVRAIVEEVELALERALPPPRFEPGATDRDLAALGLSGELADTAPLAPTPPPTSREPPELLAYRYDLKPAVFLTVEPQDEARIAASLPGYVERRERRVEVAPGDRWIDARDRGAPHVELFASRDRRVLDQLVALQSEDPSRSATQLGALLGYPACCVQAFAGQADRANNSYTRVATAYRTSIGGPWPVLLDDTALKLLPHFACTYRCERSLESARALMKALGDEQPRLRDAIDAYLGGPVLYFDHDHQLRFAGAAIDPSTIRYRSVSMPWPASEPFARFAGAVALGDRLQLKSEHVEVWRAEQLVFRLTRTDPGLGWIFPFASPAP